MDDNKFNFKIITKKDKKYIYDIIRKKYILLTEEEKDNIMNEDQSQGSPMAE